MSDFYQSAPQISNTFNGDLFLQICQCFTQGVDFRFHRKCVLLQHGFSFLHAGELRAAFAQLRVPPHLHDRHAGRAQAEQESDPVQIVGSVKPMAVAATGDGLDEPDPLVIAQRMHAEAASLGRLLDRQCVSHGRNGRSWSAL